MARKGLRRRAGSSLSLVDSLICRSHLRLGRILGFLTTVLSFWSSACHSACHCQSFGISGNYWNRRPFGRLGDVIRLRASTSGIGFESDGTRELRGLQDQLDDYQFWNIHNSLFSSGHCYTRSLRFIARSIDSLYNQLQKQLL
jgi:hypothetical protein